MTYVTEGSVAAAINALKAGKTAIEITAPEDYDTPVAIPAEANGKDISIKVTGVQGKEMSFTVAEGAQGPANLYLTSDAKDIVINCPSTHVELNGGTYDNVTATTSSTTLVVGKDVTIENLTINGGNAAIYGLVNTINKQASTIVDFYVGTADGLRNVAEKISAAPQGKDFYGKIYLTSDIDLCNVEWTPIAAFQKPLYIDGQGYTIKNLKISESTADYIGFVGTACGLTVKNLNFDTVTLSYPSTVGEEARGGVIAGHVWGATVENCIVKNVDITACQKVGGLIGYIEGDTNVPHTIKNCSVENVSIKSNDPAKILQHGAGGFIGHISLNQNPLISISGCSIKDITIADYGTADYTSSDLQRVPHVFIGNVCNNYSGDDASINTHSVVLENNTISGTNTVLPTCIYSSNYFGWAGNAEERPAWKGGIYIDGQAWTPNYPIKNVTKGIGYTTLEKAVTDAAAGDEITLENGEYTLPDLSDITIIGIGNNVVVNHSSNSICKTTNATIKNIIFNLGQNGYHGFQHASNLVLDGCIINGFMTTYGSTTYKNCTFNQDGYAYNMNAYGAEILCENCVFNGKGKAVYVYNEGNNDMYHISFEDCVFNEVVGEGTKCKAAILVKENYDNQKYVVNINNCHANFDKYIPDDPDMTGSSLWNMEIITTVTGTDVTVYLNNEKVYPFTKFKVSDAEGLRNAVKMFNKGKENTEYTIELADGTYNVSDLHIKQASGENKDPRSLLVKATNKGKVVITPNSDTKTHMIFIVSGCSNYYGSEYITFDGLKFSMTTNPNTGSHAIYCPREPAKDPIGKLLGEEVSRYAHNINILNCELQGFGTADNSLLNAPQAAGINHVKVDGCIINNAGYVVNGYFVDTKVLNSKISNVKACANTNSQGITVENCEISAWNDYCIRSNGGPIIVKNNKFNLTFNGEIKADEPAAVVYLRGANNPLEANISGNTITKAKAEMWDCYCATAWTVNDDAKTAGTGINF